MVGLLVPSGIVSDLTASNFFSMYASSKQIVSVYDFLNKKYNGSLFFKDVYYRFKFCEIVLCGSERKFPEIEFGFYMRSVSDMENPDKVFRLSFDHIAKVNPNSCTAPIFQSRRDADITIEAYRHFPPLVDRRVTPPRLSWPIRYRRLFDMANDSGLFFTHEELHEQGAYPIASGRWKEGTQDFVPLYEGKMVQAFDHRASNIVIAEHNLFRPGQQTNAGDDEHANPSFVPQPRYFVDSSRCAWPEGLQWTIAFKDITSVTNTRTMIAAIVPYCGAGHTLPVLFPLQATSAMVFDDFGLSFADYAPLICANLNAFIYDFLARQKVQGNHLTWYIVEQLPMVPPQGYDSNFGPKKVRDLISRLVLELSYVSHDMTPFAQDMGYSGPPFPWDEEQRRHSRARLDALYFYLYDLDREEASYVLDTFPIVREADEREFGRFRTKDLILGYMAAFAAGDTESRIAV